MPGVDKGKQLVSVIQDFAQNPQVTADTIIANLKDQNLDIDTVERLLNLVKNHNEVTAWRSIVNKTLFMPENANNIHWKRLLRAVSKNQAEIAKESQALGIKPEALQEFTNLDEDSVNSLLQKVKEAKAKIGSTGASTSASENTPTPNQTAGAKTSGPQTTTQEVKPDQLLNTTQNSNKSSNRLIDVINSLVIGGSVYGAGHQIAQSLQENAHARNQLLANLAALNSGQAAGLATPKDQKTELDSGGTPPKQQIPPLLAAGLGALLLGGLAQRRYGNDEGQYNSLNEALLPMLAGGLVGYGGAEAINRYT
jgi:hypothetical protein